jgi:hypothetical protein
MTTSPTAVRVSDLRAGLLAILEQVEQTHGPEIELDADHYWVLPPNVAFDMNSEPTTIDAGQLTDDIRSLRRLLSNGPDEPIEVWHDLAHVVGILNRIASLGLPG